MPIIMKHYKSVCHGSAGIGQPNKQAMTAFSKECRVWLERLWCIVKNLSKVDQWEHRAPLPKLLPKALHTCIQLIFVAIKWTPAINIPNGTFLLTFKISAADWYPHNNINTSCNQFTGGEINLLPQHFQSGFIWGWGHEVWRSTHLSCIRSQVQSWRLQSKRSQTAVL